MKRRNSRKMISKKTLLLAAVSLVLVIITAVGTTASWIEEVSQVEFSSTDGQQTPLHVGEKVLKAQATMTKDPAIQIVNLRDYFYGPGEDANNNYLSPCNMHLSPCYSDGEKFYFPVEKKSNNETVSFREGTKDDANVNYLSATFRIKSDEANTAYWFEKTGNTKYITFKKGSAASQDTALEQNLRVSITIDGVTNVYAMNSTGKFNNLESSSADSPTEYDGKRIDEYSYYAEDYNNNAAPEGNYKNTVNANTTNKPNQGAGSNLNGNTLFSVNEYDTQNRTGIKTVTVKIWLEYNSSSAVNAAADVASVNMNLVSSWAKQRRIYVKDATVNQFGFKSAKWLTQYNAKLYFALRDDLDTHWEMQRITGTDYFWADIPAVYNNAPAVFLRCSNDGWDHGNANGYTGGNKNIACWNYWETSFPDTFHSEVYTVYTTTFATWSDASEIGTVYFINSNDFANPRNYMWDSNSVYGGGINEKVVKNANWPGVYMTRLRYTSEKGWEFSASESNNCILDAQEAGYYTFRFTKGSNNDYYLSIAYGGNDQNDQPVFSTTGNSPYYVASDELNDWGRNQYYESYRMQTIGENSYVLTHHLSAGTYHFKITDNTNWYSNNSTIHSATGLTSHDYYTFQYTADYDYAVFSDGLSGGQNMELQTQDLLIFNNQISYSGKTFDMTTLTWFDATPENPANLPNYTTDYITGNFSTGGDVAEAYKPYKFAYGGQYSGVSGNAFYGTSLSHLLCKIYIKSAGDYQFVVNYGGTTYKTYSGAQDLNAGGSMTAYAEGGNNNKNIIAKNLKARTVYRIYLDPTGGYQGNPKISLYEGEN